MGEFFRISSEELGIRKEIVDFWVPLGHAMFSSSAIVPLVVGMFAVASMQGVAFVQRLIVYWSSTSLIAGRMVLHRREDCRHALVD